MEGEKVALQYCWWPCHRGLVLPVLLSIRKAHKPKATSIPLPARMSFQNTAGLTEEAFWLPAQDHYFIPFICTGLWISAGKIVSFTSGFNFGHPLNYACPYDHIMVLISKKQNSSIVSVKFWPQSWHGHTKMKHSNKHASSFVTITAPCLFYSHTLTFPCPLFLLPA